MKLHRLLTAALILSFATGHAFAETEKEKNRAEVRKIAQQALDEFYKARPSLKADVARAPGYAVFTTYGLSFIFGGQVGKGLVHNNRTDKETFMDMVQASAGLQAGLAESRILIVFNTAQAMSEFSERGFELTGAATAGAGVSTDTASATAGASMINNSPYYILTKTGLQAGGAFAGTKFFKDKKLN